MELVVEEWGEVEESLGRKVKSQRLPCTSWVGGSSESACCLTVLGRARFLLAMCIAQSRWKERQLQHGADAVRVMQRGEESFKVLWGFTCR